MESATGAERGVELDFLWVAQTPVGVGRDFLTVEWIVLTMRALWKRDPMAGVLFVPYLLWTSFAAVVTLEIARRNAK